jgi:phage terminase large subunit-like protein
MATFDDFKAKEKELAGLLGEVRKITRAKSDKGGGWNKKSVEEHIRDGTYRKDRHGPRGGGLLDWKKKPAERITASVKSQQRWCFSEADHRAVRNGCRFNEALAEYVCQFFAENLCHSKGIWADQPFVLNQWQREKLIYPLFGWVRADGSRRFRRSYIEIPKKNYKSTTASGIGIYMLTADGEPGAEIYSLGADKDQARVVHNEAVNMVDASPRLRDVLKINRTTGTIAYKAMKSFYRVLSGGRRGKAGFNIHCGIIDELHEWFGSETWDAIRYGYRARRQPLQFVITNAGNDTASVCYKQREKAIGIQEDRIQDEGFFALVCCASKEDAETELAAVAEGATSIPVAKSCNPGLGDVITEEALVADIKDAIQTPSELSNLLRLTYGIWATAVDPWLNMEHWKKCKREFTLEDKAGQDVIIGIDLSSVCDMSAIVIMGEEEETGSYWQIPEFWLPGATAQENSHLADYLQWAKEGHLHLCDTKRINQNDIADRIYEIAETVNVVGIVYDEWHADKLTEDIETELGCERIAFKQTITNYAGPTARYEGMVIDGSLHHPGHPILDWQAGHVTVKTDANGNKRPIKPEHNDHRKIDGMVAGVMALSGIESDLFAPSAYEDRGVMYASDFSEEASV